MKKLIAMLMALAMVFSLAACGDSGEKQVALGGSTSMEKVVKALIEGFNKTNPDVTLTYDMTGSGAGISGAADGTLDIGLSSRGLKEDETDVTAITIALDGIAVIVNTENTVTDLTLEQIADIATGKIANWSEVGGKEGEIVLIGRESSSGTRDGFESIVGVEDACVYNQELSATGAVIAAVAANPNAIGYASLASVDDTVTALKVNSTECSEATVKDGTYPIQRPFNFVVKDESALSESAKAFLDYARSAEGADLILVGGAVPMD